MMKAVVKKEDGKYKVILEKGRTVAEADSLEEAIRIASKFCREIELEEGVYVVTKEFFEALPKGVVIRGKEAG